MKISESPHVEHGRIAVCECRASFRIDGSTVVEEFSLPDLPPPDHIGRYRVIRYLGRGASNCVYEAVHPELRVKVAIKTLHPDYAGDKPSRDQFLQAAKVYAKAVHPNIVKVYETGKDENGVPFLAMEFLSGGSLADRLLAGKRFSPHEAAEIGASVCRALAVIDGLGIVHRDIKPDNIMISADGQCKLTDLGLAKFDAASDPENAARVLDENAELRGKRKTGFGTLEYMSPEQHVDAESCDIRSDIYSLGVTMYQLAAGRLPFETQTRTELRHMHLTVEPLVPSSYMPGIPIDFDYIVMHCIQKNPEDRYRTPAELLADLEAFLAGTPLPSTTRGAIPLVHVPFVRPEGAGRRRQQSLAALALLLVLLIVLAGSALIAMKRAGAARGRQLRPQENASQETGGPLSARTETIGPVGFNADRPDPKDAEAEFSIVAQESDVHSELFDEVKSNAEHTLKDGSGFTEAIEELKAFAASGKYASEAQRLIGELKKARDAAVDTFLAPIDLEVVPLLENHKFDDAANVYRTTVRVRAPAQEFKDACNGRAAEIEAFRVTVSAAERALENGTGLREAIEELKSFGPPSVCANEAARLVDELEKAEAAPGLPPEGGLRQ